MTDANGDLIGCQESKANLSNGIGFLSEYIDTSQFLLENYDFEYTQLNGTIRALPTDIRNRPALGEIIDGEIRF